jgi:hypothetical protein
MGSTQKYLFFARHFWDFSKIFQMLTHFGAKAWKKSPCYSATTENFFFLLLPRFLKNRWPPKKRIPEHLSSAQMDIGTIKNEAFCRETNNRG